jgi:hypothetical protein
MSAGVGNPHLDKSTLAQATSADQRRFRRYGVKLPCRVKVRAERKREILPPIETETMDVSGGGLFFLASAGLAVGTAIEFEMDLPPLIVSSPARIRCRGTITRIVPQEGELVGIGATIDYYKISPRRPKANEMPPARYSFRA